MLKLLVALLLFTISTGVVAQSDESRFRRTVEALQIAQDSLRGRFATAALFELGVIYMAEADLARNESEKQENGAKLRSWSRAVNRYAAQLDLVLADIEFGLPVELRNIPREASSVTVGGRTILLAHPRADQQFAYEQSVLSEFCTGNTCTELTAVLEGHEPIPVTAGAITPAWDFSAQGPVCSYRGVTVNFAATGNLTKYRALCLQLLQELESLAAELAWQQRHGVMIDWAAITTRPTPGKPGHLVVLNPSGDVLLLSVPLLHETPGLLVKASPWLEQRHLLDKPLTLHLDAGKLGWN